jgi:GMP synthase (glutamine-hydrolysing)
MAVLSQRRPVPGIFALIFALGVLGLVHPADPAHAGGNEAGRLTSPDSYTRPWLLVSMSPSGCSRGCRKVFSVIRELSGNPNGRTVNFKQLTPTMVAELEPEFIILGPQGTPWCRYSGATGVALQNFLWALPVMAEVLRIPILGICGGHQALALAFGGKVGPIRAGEYDCLPYSRDRQKGIVPVKVLTSDPLFRGVGAAVKIVQSHYDEVKIIPPGFRLLASEKNSPVQVMRHPTKPVYGIQGHPELFRNGTAGGAMLIRNFIRLARRYNQAVRKLPMPRGARYSLLRK